MPINNLLKKSAAIGLALLLFYYASLLGGNLKTEPQWILGALMSLCLLLHFILPRQWARLLFCVWAAITAFFALWQTGYELAMRQFSHCFTDAVGEQRCAMPTGQLFVGFVFAVIGELFVLWKLKRFSQLIWERIWQMAALTGLIAGAVYRSFS